MFGADRPYNGRKALPYAVGLTPCEPAEVFAEGEQLDPDKPAQLYNADGFPLCCLNQATMEGGVEWNGSADVTLVTPDLLGSTCATGADLVPGPPVAVVMPPVGIVGWLNWTFPANGNYRYRFLSCSDPLAQWHLKIGGDCDSLVDVGILTVGNSGVAARAVGKTAFEFLFSATPGSTAVIQVIAEP